MSQNSEELIEETELPTEIIESNLLIVSDRSDLPEMIDYVAMNYLKFEHIYNGMIVKNDSFCGMVEIKIKAPKIRCGDSEFEFRFVLANHKCGWFNVDGGSSQLVGPVEFDGEKFVTTGERHVRFNESSEFDLIDNIDNDVENIISSDDFPPWMLRDLTRSVGVVESKFA
jgi:hypothetical protein